MSSFFTSAGRSSFVNLGTSEQKSSDDLLLHLARTQISDKRPRRLTGEIYAWTENNVLTVRHNESIARAMAKLTTEGFLSAPVLDSDGSYVGMVDTLDLVRFCTDIFAGETSSSWIDFFSKRNEWKDTTVGDIMKTKGFIRRTDPLDVYCSLQDGYSLLHAYEVLARTTCHRLPVVNNTKKIVGIYTNSMAISHIKQNLYMYGNLADTKVGELVQTYNVASVRDTELALTAFQQMANQNVSGLAVTDVDGILTGSISIRDLRGIGSDGENFARLFNSVKQFKEDARREFPRQAPSTHYSSKTVPRGSLYVTPDQTFREVINKMNDGNIHRIFVCSKQSHDMDLPRATSVISQTDIIKQTLSFLGTMRF